jgi:hypothetical protein
MKDCNNCGNRAMDMSMDPYCAAVNKPYGRDLTRSPKPTECGPNSLLWIEDTRGKNIYVNDQAKTAHQEARAEERAAIVAWMRTHDVVASDGGAWVADAINAGMRVQVAAMRAELGRLMAKLSMY